MITFKTRLKMKILWKVLRKIEIETPGDLIVRAWFSTHSIILLVASLFIYFLYFTLYKIYLLVLIKFLVECNNIKAKKWQRVLGKNLWFGEKSNISCSRKSPETRFFYIYCFQMESHAGGNYFIRGMTQHNLVK